VLGAGRGPLVSASIRAAAAARVRARVLCVEKNANALVTLAHRRASDSLWRDAAVEVVGADMRGWAGPGAAEGDGGRADVLVSELLGSLGDNELSPGARAAARAASPRIAPASPVRPPSPGRLRCSLCLPCVRAVLPAHRFRLVLAGALARVRVFARSGWLAVFLACSLSRGSSLVPSRSRAHSRAHSRSRALFPCVVASRVRVASCCVAVPLAASPRCGRVPRRRAAPPAGAQPRCSPVLCSLDDWLTPCCAPWMIGSPRAVLLG
jgi:hypothetical protein